MMNVKEKMSAVVNAQPEDSSIDEILRELAFLRMIEKGLDDSRQNRMIPHAEMKQRMLKWRK
ncbi:hypothetical protein KEF85_03600 [Methylomonas paludis]|uniref:Uncharacterized protein n=1 Tax=Methylomonas paludis TaxID=1173101 RepID=A0A975MQC5_9GAMM|nr:hypothetical protein [Methylomonas paludis]QWF71576.1 hypothetical protein KEF85_03600 [Methylomonas paludis]